MGRKEEENKYYCYKSGDGDLKHRVFKTFLEVLWVGSALLLLKSVIKLLMGAQLGER